MFSIREAIIFFGKGCNNFLAADGTAVEILYLGKRYIDKEITIGRIILFILLKEIFVFFLRFDIKNVECD